MCHVTGFLPYFYIPAPVGFRREQLKPFQLALEVRSPANPALKQANGVESGESRTTGDSSH